MTEESDPELNHVLARFCIGGSAGSLHVLRRLAVGGMAEVFLVAREGPRGFCKHYVLKRLLPSLQAGGDPRFVDMMLDEARLGAMLSHPNICQVFDVWQDNDSCALLMEYLRGVSLSRLLKRRTWDPNMADLRFLVGLLGQACDGLHFAHELADANGVKLDLVHRDVSPSNLFVTFHGVVKLLDFGIAKTLHSLSTSPGTRRGKIAYMSPEQLLGRQLDRRSDVFALATVAHEALCGRRLFRRPTSMQTMRAILEEDIPPVSAFRPGIPTALDEVINRAIARSRIERFDSAKQLGDALRDAVKYLGGPASREEIADRLSAAYGEDRILAQPTAVIEVPSESDPQPETAASFRFADPHAPPPADRDIDLEADTTILDPMPLSTLSGLSRPAKLPAPALQAAPATQEPPPLRPTQTPSTPLGWTPPPQQISGDAAPRFRLGEYGARPTPLPAPAPSSVPAPALARPAANALLQPPLRPGGLWWQLTVLAFALVLGALAIVALAKH